jgi:hypothetical protein
MGTLGVLGAFLHAHSVVVKIAKWSWSKAFGKIVYLIVTTVCIAIGHADAVRTTRQLVHADAKYFPSFLGLLSSWYACVNLAIAIAVIIFCYGFVQFVINITSAFLRGIYWPQLFPGTTRPLLDRWHRMRFNLDVKAQLAAREGHLRGFTNLFTPIVLMSAAPMLAQVPGAVMKAPLTQSILEAVVFKMEYTSDDECPNVPADRPTVHVDGDFVSAATFVNGRLATTRLTCHIDPADKVPGQARESAHDILTAHRTPPPAPQDP